MGVIGRVWLAVIRNHMVVTAVVRTPALGTSTTYVEVFWKKIPAEKSASCDVNK